MLFIGLPTEGGSSVSADGKNICQEINSTFTFSTNVKGKGKREKETLDINPSKSLLITYFLYA